jgi:F420-0:gamma-glutamyl ligase
MQTLEAVVDRSGKISLLEKVRLKRKSRALVTILDEEPKQPNDADVRLPTNEVISDREVLSLWANREESAQEIARKIRANNRATT